MKTETLCEKLQTAYELSISIKSKISEISSSDDNNLDHIIDLLNNIDNFLSKTNGTKIENKVFNKLSGKSFKNIYISL